MLYPFFELAGRSESRQQVFRRLLAAHLVLVGGVVIVHALAPRRSLFEMLGHTTLIAGIVEGALILGWRLTQLPKSRALEPLLLSPVSPRLVMRGEQLVGLAYFTLISLSSIPLFVYLVAAKRIEPAEAIVPPLFGFTWGCVTGLGLTWWAYEPLAVRKWGERISLACILVYLVVGGLAGEKTFQMLSGLPFEIGQRIRDFFLYFNANNPFALIHRISMGNEDGLLGPVLICEGVGIALIVLFFVRASHRLKEHYIERNYRPLDDEGGGPRGEIGDRPLSWWAVRRVNEYSGRINLWLAVGATILYASYLLFQHNWPSWLGRHTFIVYEMLGGVAGISSALVILAAVPAAYQYGLWDSSIPERCKKLELLLLTDLGGRDFLRASWSAAWNRGRGYLGAAVVLWLAGYGAGRYGLLATIAAVLSGLLLVALYFAIGFRCFAQNRGAMSLGFVLTIVLPLATWGIAAAGGELFVRWLPPGMVYYATARPIEPWPVVGAFLAYGAITALLLYQALATFDRELREWYDANHGKKT